MRINTSHRSGFTLLELIVVIAIVMIMSMVAVGSYSVMQQRRSLRSGAEGLNSAFVTARSYAVSRNAWHRVIIQLKDPITGAETFRYWIDEIAMNTNLNPTPFVPEVAVRPQITTPQSLPVGVRVLDSTIRGTSYPVTAAVHYIVRFQPNGSADQALIRLQEDSTSANQLSPIASIRIHPATAKSKILADVAP